MMSIKSNIRTLLDNKEISHYKISKGTGRRPEQNRGKYDNIL